MSLHPVETGISQSLRPVWSTEQVLGHPGLHREIMSRKTKRKKKIRSQHTGTAFISAEFHYSTNSVLL